MNHDQAYRVSLLTTVLLWEGRLNNSRLRELFDLGGTRSSQWIRELRELHPQWVRWDSVTRSYLATDALYKQAAKPPLNRGQASGLAQYLALVGITHVTSEQCQHPGLWSAFPDFSAPDPALFARIAESIRTGRSLEIVYSSMATPEPRRRTISAHTLVRAGRRWHVRGFCATRQDFRDFALGRIRDAVISDQPRQGEVTDDDAWNATVPVRVVAHPGLSIAQQELVRFENFSGKAARVHSCRGALVGYFIQDIRAATRPEVEVPPDFQLAVENLAEVRPWLF